jgi:O-methyltransferase
MRTCFNRVSEGKPIGILHNLACWLADKLVKVENAGRYESNRWLYEKEEREEFFYKAMQFLKFNQIQGDYLEFGLAGGCTFMLAHKHNNLHGLGMHLYGFDSFKGLPKPEGIDVHPQWSEGDMAFPIDCFRRKLTKYGIGESDYTLVSGFYSDSLTDATRKKLGLNKAALVYVDCDLHKSTASVLRFVLHILQNGTVIAFDDWFAFNGDPERGQQLALQEFLNENPNITMVDFLGFGWHGKSFIIKKSE